MCKPIVVVKIDVETDMGNGRSFESEKLHIEKYLGDKLVDYHVFVLPIRNAGDEPITFQVFYEKDFTPIQYQELKDLVMQSIGKK